MSQSALLVMDVQDTIVARYGGHGDLGPLRRAVGAARAHGIPVIYVVVGFRPGRPEVSPRNKVCGPLAGRETVPGEEEANRIHTAVAPREGDVIVTKRRVSAFSGSDLDMVLRAGGIDHLVLTGVATSGVVLSTLRQAADLDYVLTVLSDACLDGDPEVHRVLTEKVFPRQAEVTTADAWSGTL